VGHRYSPESFVDAQANEVESALWAAIRALEDRSRLLERLADQVERHGQTRSARSFRHRATSARDQAQTVRSALAGAAEGTLKMLPDQESEVLDAEAAEQ
jgi:two-component system chemotaxis response regulator CheB